MENYSEFDQPIRAHKTQFMHFRSEYCIWPVVFIKMSYPPVDEYTLHGSCIHWWVGLLILLKMC